jgi:carboxypeptidase C (cathepsin A)
MRHAVIVGLAATLTLASLQVPAQSAASASPVVSQPVLRKAVTHHTQTLNGVRIRYTATVAENLLRDANGAPAATVVTVAYVRDNVKERSKRPVLFLFNGGPGASSSPLHMSALGPVIRTPASSGDRSSGRWTSNPQSPLDAADLVFIDPVGAGFSRPLPGADAKPFYSVSGDARAVKTVIAEWLAANGRTESPRYLVGESYGTTRAATIASSSPEMAFDGVLLVALAGETPGREMPYVASLPTMAAGAWWHRRIERADRTVEQVFADAAQFARSDYVSALIQGGSLAPSERKRIAERMSALIGLPADFIESKNLRISKNDWMFNLLKEQGLRTGLLDVTVTAPLEEGADGAIDDPALGVVPRRAPGQAAAPPPTPAQIGPVPSPVVGRYLSEVLKFPATEPYYGVNFAVNAAWDYEDRSNAFEALATAMRANPKLRLFWAAGYYDLTTPAYAGRYTLDQAGIPAERLKASYFAGPHGVYDTPENRASFAQAVRAFVTSAGTVTDARDAHATTAPFEITLRPVRDAGGEVSAIEVHETIPAAKNLAGAALRFSAPVTYAAVTHVADRIQSLKVQDADGLVPLETTEDPAASGGYPYYRHWTPSRPIKYPVEVSFSAGVQPAGSPRGPAFGIRPSAGGVSGSGGGFLLLPEISGATRTRLTWDLAGLAAGSVASTTYGDGNIEIDGGPEKLTQAWMLAGPAQRYTPSAGSQFHAFWLGDPPFDAKEEMHWAAKAYDYMARFYDYMQPPAYRVYMRVLDTPPFGGGTALGNSFMLSMGKESARGSPRTTFFHEMSHQWVGGIEGPADQIAWYQEGLNVFYTTLLPLRGGLMSFEAYQSAINNTATEYYTSPARNWSQAQIGKVGFGDERVRHTPYNRGALYWAQLDWQIRRKSNGKRNLDSFFRPLWAQRQRGTPFDQAVIETQLAKEFGPDAVERFRAQLIDGVETVVPDSGAFGPCLARKAVVLDGPNGNVEGYQWERVTGVADVVCRKW